MEQIQIYIEEYYSQPITRESLAQMLNYSVPYIAKQFKQKTGRSIIDYLIQIRIQKAQQLLIHTTSSLQEIASSVGYEDVSYFIRIFKSTVGKPQCNLNNSQISINRIVLCIGLLCLMIKVDTTLY